MDHINDYANKALKGSSEAKEMVVHYTDGKGKRRIKGGSDLKSSQSYPRGWFGLQCKVCCFVHKIFNSVMFWASFFGTTVLLTLGPPHTSPTTGYPATPRFGRAVAKVRSKFQKIHHQQGAKFLRNALKCEDTHIDCRPKTHNMWVKHANLEPIFAFLAKQ